MDNPIFKSPITAHFNPLSRESSAASTTEFLPADRSASISSQVSETNHYESMLGQVPEINLCEATPGPVSELNHYDYLEPIERARVQSVLTNSSTSTANSSAMMRNDLINAPDPWEEWTLANTSADWHFFPKATVWPGLCWFATFPVEK